MQVNRTFPEIICSRLRLRRISDMDKALIFSAMSDERMVQYYGCRYETLTQTQSLMDWFELIFTSGIGLWWGICLKDAPEHLIGACGIHDWDQQQHTAELGFWLLPTHWQQGFMQECMQNLFPFFFTTLKLHRLQARVEAGNFASHKLLLHSGFQLEGVMRDAEFKKSRYVDVYLYARLATDSGDLLNNTQ